MAFQIRALPAAHFERLFQATPEQLASLNGLRMVATRNPGFPCRVSLQDAEMGEEVVLAHYVHQPANTPFKASHAVYVRVSAKQAELPPNEIPQMLRSRTLSLRAFDKQGMMLAADLAEGTALDAAIETLLADSCVDYVQLHFAKPGCYAARADRA